MSTSITAAPTHRLRNVALQVVPWLITVVALYVAFHDVDWATLGSHLGDGDPFFLVLAVAFTCLSYLMRARRWQFLFETRVLHFAASCKVLLLGFFMNNVLPARAGEFVRAHLGAKVAGVKRTLVLASVASERLADGLMLSAMFMLFALGKGTHELSTKLLYVALVFGVAAVGVIVTLAFREQLFTYIRKVNNRLDSRASNYTFDRLQVFINGLAPLFSPPRIPLLALWSVAIWLTELCVYIFITRAFNADLRLSFCVLFLVVVNFSSLIPAAPGGIGVIEAIASAVLISIGIPKEMALTMVIVQHVTQYLVVGIPGAILMVTWNKQLKALKGEDDRD